MNALRHVDLKRVFFVAIETVPCADCHDQLDATRRALWESFCGQRHTRELAAGQTLGELFDQAGRYAEFGKVVCISVGYFTDLADGTLEFRVKSFADDDECAVLAGFANLLGNRRPYGTRLPGATTHVGHPDKVDHRQDPFFLCAHDGRAFDYTYLGRRMLICGQLIPPLLDVASHPSRDLPHLLDTLELWKFGDPKSNLSLPLLAGVLGIPASQDAMDGAQVARTYWAERDLARLVRHCQQDVETTARVLLRYLGQHQLWDAVQVTHLPWAG